MAESSPGTDPLLARALDRAVDALARRPAGLLTDFDGTLSPIVDDPATARLVAGTSEALEVLSRRLAVVAVVTGRGPADARRMTGVPGMLIAGNHGTEWLEPHADAARPSSELAAVRDRLAATLARVPELPGVQVEDKGASATVHYRTAPDPERARSEIVAGIGEPDEGLELRPGKMSLELRPVGLGDKGAATRTIIGRFGLRGAVVMGDDLTDLDMFAAVAEARAGGRLGGLIIGVGGTDGEAPEEVVAAADVVLSGGPEQAALLLRELARRLG